MPGATLPEVNGVADWVDNVDNWRASDAEYLQARSVLRFTTTTQRDNLLTPTAGAGQTIYVAETAGVGTTDGLQFFDKNDEWQTLATYKNLSFSDTDTGFGWRFAGDPADVLIIEPGQVVLGSNRSLIVDASHVYIKTGTARATLTTDNTFLIFDIPIKAPAATITGALTVGSIANSGTLTTASVAASGALSGSSLNISGVAGIGTVNVADLNVSGDASAATAHITGASDLAGLRVSAERLSSISHVASFVDLGAVAQLAGTDVVLAPVAATTAIRYRGITGPPVAVVVVSAADPGAGNYPEGCFWVQP
jgi:hypothetical protein